MVNHASVIVMIFKLALELAVVLPFHFRELDCCFASLMSARRACLLLWHSIHKLSSTPIEISTKKDATNKCCVIESRNKNNIDLALTETKYAYHKNQVLRGKQRLFRL